MCIFSQYGEVLDVNLVRDKKTGKSKGFAFLKYEDQRSTILAVDNFTGSKVLGRSLRVDHVSEYKQPKRDGEDGEDWEQDPRASMNVAPVQLLTPEQQAAVQKNGENMTAANVTEEDYTHGIDPEDPMFEYLVNERREAAQRRFLKQKKSTSAEPRESSRHHRSRSERNRSPRRVRRSHSRGYEDKGRHRTSHRSSRRDRSTSP